MSEYWVSRKKYWCKYCEIYITDDAPSKTQHENGLRHKGNKERFVKNLYKQGERRKKDLDEEKREMARIELAANAAFAKDVSAGHASASSSKSMLQSTPEPSSSRKPPPKPTSAFSNYSTAESLGYTDPDEEIRKLRQAQGVVGQWEIVAPPPPPLPGTQSVKEEEDVKPAEATTDNADQPPGAQGNAAEHDNETDARHFKIRKRKLDLGLDDLWDPGDIPIKLKAPKTDAVEGPAPVNGVLAASTSSGTDTQQQSLDSAPDRPKWISKGWTRATQQEAETESAVAPLSHIQERGASNHNSDDPKTEAMVESPSIMSEDARPGGIVKPPISASINHEQELDIDVKPVVKEEEASTQLMAPTSLFRKRKIPAKR
ncbi:hypothetical protein SCHPADRAFT_818122 [Schizopora paradoxa]|uniref:Matrin-type domain-containing protein n=1 Tax=Schizopora paradoxa TaxID=27342 RepID=A0A0H2S6A3_9AGAM|nr:hypothetical protein SCHPADRAFT_818122 [Schizopora paradoxa]